MRVMSINLSDGVRSFTISGGADRSSFQVQLDMWMEITVLNTNKYYMKVDEITLDTYIDANIPEINKEPGARSAVGGPLPRRVFAAKDALVKMGSGRKGSVTFPQARNVSFQMNLTVTYKPNPSYDLADDVLFNELMQSCGILKGIPRRTMVVKYKAEAPIKIISWTGWKPTFENELKINCPFPPDQLQTIIGNLKGSVSKAQKSLVIEPIQSHSNANETTQSEIQMKDNFPSFMWTE
jgi:hypothetical protein